MILDTILIIIIIFLVWMWLGEWSKRKIYQEIIRTKVEDLHKDHWDEINHILLLKHND